MSIKGNPQPVSLESVNAIRRLEGELADTRREVLELTLELVKSIEEMRAAEERYRRLVQNAPDVIFHYELLPSPRCAFVNPRVTPLSGYAPEDYYADPDLCFKVVHPDDLASLEAIFRGECTDVNTRTLRWVHRNGTTAWIEQHHVLARNAGGEVTAIECIARDITDRKLLEEQILQSQKMEAIGRLTGGIAHDFNNLLTVINGCSALALEAVEHTNPLYRELEEINNAGELASNLTAQLLAFSRRQVLTPRVLDLNLIVAEMDRMLRRVLGEDIELHTNLTPGLDCVRADRAQIEQVIMNLAVNARDAMKFGGRLLIETSNIDLSAGDRPGGGSPIGLASGVASGKYVMLVIADTGCGMDEATQARVFEPFFTTKADEGTGLGLSTVFGIVQQCGGHLFLSSEVGQGTTFRIFFPKVSGKAQASAKKSAGKRVRGSETVLVVEDQDNVRDLVRSVMKRSGYTLLEARSGSEAVQLCRQHEGTIHLVITDVVMPGMSGQELAERLQTIRPGLKTLLMSGYAHNVISGNAGTPLPFLQKPFTPDLLAMRVRETLDAVIATVVN